MIDKIKKGPITRVSLNTLFVIQNPKEKRLHRKKALRSYPQAEQWLHARNISDSESSPTFVTVVLYSSTIRNKTLKRG